VRRLARLVLLLAALALAALVWVRPAPPPLPGAITGKVERIVIEKAARRMTLWQGERPLREYSVALGFEPSGDKEREGDGRTPEGLFRIDRLNPDSAYHLSLGLDYPRPQDRARAAAGGHDPGGDIFIHGQPNAMPPGTMLRGDWTAGCIALTDAQIAEVFAATPIGTPVEIRP
jgi:murein L,D-transpeptidase YafK